ncbi:osteoclast-stimulating factor 1-like [Actinia tenebrosa]|uniref:Osteoclast-stimulating factor 1 n=1 Tax=Actinia tenebrosa TaxID=6105 RepID=A0A6P8I444_ACTTE|nr:osteoclast-stimulating factor 1-like [Actinia tenebrosa]
MSSAAPSRPPPPIPRPGQVQVVRACYNYTASQPDELSFEEGDILYILDKGDGQWWKAKVGKKTGLIPSNYVEEHTESVENPLHEAAKRGNIGFMQECLQNKVSVNGLDKSGSTPLHWAAQGGHTECAKMLLSQPRVQVNVQNKLGDTPLHSASWKGHADIVELLLEKGAKTDIKNNDKKLPYDLARDADVGKLLRGSAGEAANDYGEDEDSD